MRLDAFRLPGTNRRWMSRLKCVSVGDFYCPFTNLPMPGPAMLSPPKPSNEEARLRLLRSLDILDTPAEEVFDRVTRVLAQLLDVPITLVSLVDESRQWVKSRVGTDLQETPRSIAFCAHAIHVEDIFLIEDTLADPGFEQHPLVVNSPHIRFYAGIPLRSVDGLALGTLCAIDRRPRVLTPGMKAAFHDLASIVERELLQRAVTEQGKRVWEEERLARARSDARFATIFRETPTGKIIVDLKGRFIEANPKFCELTGYAADELTRLRFTDITHPDDIGADRLLAAELVAGTRTTYSVEKRYIHRDGSPVWAQVSVSLLQGHEGHAPQFIAVVMDIGERKRSEQMLQNHSAELERSVAERTLELERSRRVLQTITDNLPVLIAQVDKDLCYQFNNRIYQDIFGVTPSELAGKPLASILSADLLDELMPYFQRALAGERVTKESVRYQPGRDQLWNATYIPEVRDGEVVGFFVMSQDVTEQKRFERALFDKAMLDPLTDLPNRRALQDRLDDTISSDVPFVVLFMDLDGFKVINDAHGHDVGDELLKHVGRRLLQAVRKGDFVCRLAGDEFVVVAEGIPNMAIAERIAADITSAIEKPFELSVGALSVGVSVGIASSISSAMHDSNDVMARADSAMYEAKRRRRDERS